MQYGFRKSLLVMLLNSNYLKGQYAEYAVRRKLESLGFIWIIRSYASKSPIDLLCSNGLELWAVQAKSNSATSSPVNDLNCGGLFASAVYLSNLIDQSVTLASCGQIEESL